MRHFKHYALQGTATFALLTAAFPAAAQVIIDEDTEEQIVTSSAGADGSASDVTISGGDENDNNDNPKTITGNTSRPAVVLDSDNALNHFGNIVIDIPTAADQADGETPTAVLLEGGADRSYLQTGSITITEDFTPDDTNTGVAEGAGRTGILISGASPFQGNIELTNTASILVEGNDSYGINLANTPMMTEGLTGNLTTNGSIAVSGDRSVGVNIGSGVTGDIINDAQITVQGEDAQGYLVDADIQGGFVNAGTISTSGFRSNTRAAFLGETSEFGREDLTANDLRQSGSALTIAGNVSGGILLAERESPVLVRETGQQAVSDTAGELSFSTLTSNIIQFGGAPAVLIGRDGDPIAVGVISEVTDPDAEDYDEDLLYAFVNQGSVTATGINDDIDATTVSISNATLTGGLNNTGSLSASSYRAAVEGDLTEGDGTARVLVLGDNAIVDRINNSGLMLATASESIDEVYADANNIIAPRNIEAVAIDIGTNASVTDLVNSGSISAVIIGREGQAVAIRDSSGTLSSISNNGIISATGVSSDETGEADLSLDFIALDLTALTEDFTFTQTASDVDGVTSRVSGDILLGSGNDSLTLEAGNIQGDIDFGGGNNSLTLAGDSFFIGELSNTETLTLSATDTATLALTSATPVQVANATFSGTSTFRPVINGETGEASTLLSDGAITFETGASVNPLLQSVLNDQTGVTTQSFDIAISDNLSVGDLNSLSSGITPFIFDTNLSLQGTDTLVITLDLRDPAASIENGGMGLDSVQAEAFGEFVGQGADRTFQGGAVFDALSSAPALGNAFANITEAAEFYAAINQVLPEFSGAANQFVLANVDGSVGAVGSHLDTTRRSPEKTGGAWLQEFFYFADRELAGLSEQYRGQGFGFVGGLDTAFGPFHAVGISAGFSSTEVEDVVGIDEPLDVRTYTLGTYAGFEKGGFSLDAYGGIGYNQFEQNRNIQVGDFFGTATGEWDGFHANANLRAGYTIPLSEKFWVRPRASVDYLYLNEYGHTETGTQGFRTRVDGRRTETASATAMLDFGANFQGKRTWIKPSIRVGYRNEFISDPVETAFRFQGLQNEDGELFDSEIARLRSLAFPDEGIILGFTVAAGSEYSSIGFDFDSDIRDGFIRHTGRIVIRLLF